MRLTSLKYIQNIYLEKEEAEISKLLYKNKVVFTFLKGLTFLRYLTPDYLTLRQIQDIDILISEKYLDVTLAVLQKYGYSIRTKPKVFYQEYMLVKKSPGLLVEIHTTAFNYYRSRLIDKLFLPLTEHDMQGITDQLLQGQFKYTESNYVIFLLYHYCLNHCFCGYDRLFSFHLLFTKMTPREWRRLVVMVQQKNMQVYFAIVYQLLQRLTIFDGSKKQPIKNSFSTKIYVWIFFMFYSTRIVYSTIDTPLPHSAEQNKRYLRLLQSIKILCANQPLGVKMLAIIRLFLLSLWYKSRGVLRTQRVFGY